MSSFYVCKACGGRFNNERTEEDCNAEALALFGVENASQRTGDGGDMAIICDECGKRLGFGKPEK